MSWRSNFKLFRVWLLIVSNVEDFLQQFNGSQQKKAQLKKLISQTFKELQENKIIQNQFKLITKSGKIKEIDELIPLRIGQSKTIYFYISTSG